MADLSARHYLGIYRLRLTMAEKGTTHPKPEMITFARDLVGRLSALDPDTKIRLESQERLCRFTVADSGALLAEMTW